MSTDLSGEKLPIKYSIRDTFQALYNTSVKLDLPVAIWKLPNQTAWELIIGEKTIELDSPQIELLEPGFIVNKFRNRGLKKSLFIKAKFYISNDFIDYSLIETLLGKTFTEFFYKELSAIKKRIQFNIYLIENKRNETLEFKNRVERAVEEINQGAFQKVILSRRKEINFSEEVDHISIFEKLSQQNGNAFTSLVSIPEIGVWMGASPETLICIKDNIFSTCSLAGTQQFKENVRLKDVLWSQKEIEEQAFVSRYIINCFKKIRLREYIEEGPKTVPAGKLLHLKTEFKVDMEEVDFPILGTQMLELLHPTSAVCGMPHEPAFEFILSQENFDRELYAGYLGPVNINNSIGVFVNLRCMKIEGQKAILFAGVGITEDSDAEKEWLETEMKFGTLLNVLSN
ncbi:MAG TPA: chorismate-binding protein [Cytophagales bacterium]|nr:chorismate-binding protein [Cytophagales bacterium]